MSAAETGEFALIAQLTRRIERGRRAPGVQMGIGDDAAVVSCASDVDWVMTCDSHVDGRHFVGEWITPCQLGRRIATVNMSDIAAMGAHPLYALASLFLVPGVSSDYLQQVYDGMVTVFSAAGAEVVGGNVAGGVGALGIDVFLVGTVERGEALLRKSATVGQVICVTGTLGDSGMGLEILESKGAQDVSLDASYLMSRHLEPTARLSVGRALRAIDGPVACMDVSDGLVQDLRHMAVASGVSMTVDVSRIPMSPQLRRCAQTGQARALTHALYSGEDYELLFTLDAAVAEKAIRQLQAETGIDVTVIGEVVDADGDPAEVRLRGNGAGLVGQRAEGFDHVRCEER